MTSSLMIGSALRLCNNIKYYHQLKTRWIMIQVHQLIWDNIIIFLSDKSVITIQADSGVNSKCYGLLKRF
jgi:hypothetical protein